MPCHFQCKLQNSSFTSMITYFNEIEDQCHVIIVYVALNTKHKTHLLLV